jgi:hypothetical protein
MGSKKVKYFNTVDVFFLIGVFELQNRFSHIKPQYNWGFYIVEGGHFSMIKFHFFDKNVRKTLF